jgi:hypothetical protein
MLKFPLPSLSLEFSPLRLYFAGILDNFEPLVALTTPRGDLQLRNTQKNLHCKIMVVKIKIGIFLLPPYTNNVKLPGGTDCNWWWGERGRFEGKPGVGVKVSSNI